MTKWLCWLWYGLVGKPGIHGYGSLYAHDLMASEGYCRECRRTKREAP